MKPQYSGRRPSSRRMPPNTQMVCKECQAKGYPPTTGAQARTSNFRVTARVRQKAVILVTVLVGLFVGVEGSVHAQNYLQQKAKTAQAPVQPQYPAKGMFGDWVFSCPAPTQCSISQKMAQASSNALLLWLEIAKNPADPSAFLATVMTPLGFNLMPPLAFRGNKAEIFKVAVNRCVASGCVHMGALSREATLSLSSQSTLRAKYLDEQGRSLEVSLSTKGLGEALAALDRLAYPHASPEIQ